MKASLSICVGPQVEQSISIMNDVINAKNNRMHVDTFAAIQTVKYALKSRQTTSVQAYHRELVHKAPVDKSLVYHMQTAYGRHKKKTDKKAQATAQATVLAATRTCTTEVMYTHWQKNKRKDYSIEQRKQIRKQHEMTSYHAMPRNTTEEEIHPEEQGSRKKRQ